MKRTLLKFYADYCGPCKALTILFEEMSEVFEEKNIEVKEIDVDKNIQMAQDYGVKAIPYLVLLDDENQVLKYHKGLILKDKLEEFIA